MLAKLDQLIHIQVLRACLTQFCNVFCGNIVITEFDQFIHIQVFEACLT